jgi:hypothetical protein
MDAATFGAYFEELVLPPALDVGFEPWGKSLWMERDGLQVGVLRTELRKHLAVPAHARGPPRLPA